MGKSNSNLLNYISHLMDPENESQLRDFVVDPISDAENEWGLTKAERAVLRRTVAGLSNNSVNGYSIDRSLSSYRRSLRLLQNVLHKNAAHGVHDHLAGQSESDEANPSYYTVVVYFPRPTSNNDYTGLENSAVNANGGPYYYAEAWHIPGSYVGSNPMISDVMRAIQSNGIRGTYGDTLQYTTDATGEVVLSFTVIGNTFTANLRFPDGSTNPAYDPPIDHDNVFWFYTLDGGPNVNYAQSQGQAGYSGGDGVSFLNTPANVSKGNQTGVIYWQLIAPDKFYGYNPCIAHPRNAYGKAKAKADRAALESANG